MIYLEDCGVRPLSEFLELVGPSQRLRWAERFAAKKYLDIIARGCCHGGSLLWTIRCFLIGSGVKELVPGI